MSQSSSTEAARAPVAGGQAATDDSGITGTWRGNSTCEVKESACRDEVNVYRIWNLAGRPGWVSVAGSKVVDNREIAMGTLEWKYDASKHTLQSADGAFRFTLDGDKLEGTLTRGETVFRRIHLKRQK